jgi:hypothetical protein
MTCPGFLCIWVGIASMRFPFTVMRSNNSNIILANLSFDDDHVFDGDGGGGSRGSGSMTLEVLVSVKMMIVVVVAVAVTTATALIKMN